VEPAADAGAEEISMEDVLGAGREAPVAEKESVDEVPQVESPDVLKRNWFRDSDPRAS